MELEALARRYPIPTATTGVALAAIAATVAYFAGLVPVIPKTLPMFVTLLQATGLLVVLAVIAWMLSLWTS